MECVVAQDITRGYWEALTEGAVRFDEQLSDGYFQTFAAYARRGAPSAEVPLDEWRRDTRAPSTPADMLSAHASALLEAYGRHRESNKPLDSLFAAIDEVFEEGERALVREFALGKHDDDYGEGAGYRAVAPLLPAFDEATGYLEWPEERSERWSRMGIVDLAEEIGSDPLLTDMFLWTVHHHMDDDGAKLISLATTALARNASEARTTTGRSIKTDQAVRLLRVSSEKAHQSALGHQEMWCTAIANAIATQSR
jgi:hypothetical protein